jgi:hypothetical protein
VIRRSAPSALLVVAVLAFAGCGGGGSTSEPAMGGTDTSTPAQSPSGTKTTTGSATHSTPGPTTGETKAVDGVTLTPEGSRLKVGDTARVSWQPTQKKTGVIAVTVTGLLRMPISAFSAWRLNGEVRHSTPYFVHATVRNLGRSDLSHVAVPLYLLDHRQTLLQSSTFQARFTPCPSRPLPANFKRGHQTSVCLVYFAPHHGKLVAISFRPSEDFDAITWQGDVVNGGVRQHHKQPAG